MIVLERALRQDGLALCGKQMLDGGALDRSARGEQQRSRNHQCSHHRP
jgi:hypothetical protein